MSALKILMRKKWLKINKNSKETMTTLETVFITFQMPLSAGLALSEVCIPDILTNNCTAMPLS